MKTKVILVQGGNEKWYIKRFEDGNDYMKSGWETLDGVVNAVKNTGAEIVLIMNNKQERIELNDVKGGISE